MAELDVLLLRFDAPLMSFGGVRVDERGVIDEVPGLSLVTGLLANALGWDHGDAGALERLQARLRMAVRRDLAGTLLEDFQTVDLGQPCMEPGWTTRHRPSGRLGASGRGTHIRRRQYWADAVFTVAVALDPAAEEPTATALEKALEQPERPLFLGRKPCLPSRPLLLGRTRSATLKDAVGSAPLARRAAGLADRRFAVWWPEGDAPAPPPESGDRQPVYDLRDWANQVHVGRRFLHRGSVEIREEAGDG
jgi:CRISPR system Cascade subunit CasD